MSDIVTNGLNAVSGADAALEIVVPPVLEHAALPAPVAMPGKQSRLEVRIWCTFVFLMCAAMFGLALYLTPSQGLHQKFGVPECGMMQMTGYPCPTCGCTTAVTYLAHGNPLASVATQPFGFGVGFLAFLLLPLTGLGMVTGKWKGPTMFWLSYHWRYWTYGGAAILMGAWAYRAVVVQMHLFGTHMPTLW